MAEVHQIINVPTDLIFTCPACAEDIEVVSIVRLNEVSVEQTSDARRAGPAEFGATINSEVLGVRIVHTCASARLRPGIFTQRGTNRQVYVGDDE